MKAMDLVEIVIKWAVPALCAALAGWAVGQVRHVRQADNAVRLGVQALLRDRIYQAHSHYMERGVYPIYARENVEEMYKQYHALGGNGTVTNLVKEMDALPTTKGRPTL